MGRNGTDSTVYFQTEFLKQRCRQYIKVENEFSTLSPEA